MPPKGQRKNKSDGQAGGAASFPNSGSKPNIGFLPPGTTKKQAKNHSGGKQQQPPSYDDHDESNFEYGFEENVPIPRRLLNKNRSLVNAANDFHFAMMNDTPRNAFYYSLLKKHITPESGVLEIGAGSGLLSMMAANLGAKWVVAVEGSPEMAELARRNIAANNLQDKITVLNMLSTDLQLKDMPAKPDVLVSEIFGTLLLGESALDYIADVRKRLLKPETKIVPQCGVQYAVLVECPLLTTICAVKSWQDIQLSQVMALQDTISTVFTKQYGFRMSSVPYRRLCEPVPLLAIDFAKHTHRDFAQEFAVPVKATASGTAHAWMYYWVSEDGDERMSTDPQDTLDNFARDMQWGQALQLIDEGSNPDMPTALTVEEGHDYTFRCICTHDRVVVHMAYQPEKKSE